MTLRPMVPQKKNNVHSTLNLECALFFFLDDIGFFLDLIHKFVSLNLTCLL